MSKPFAIAAGAGYAVATVTRWIHVLALSGYFGATLALIFVFLPAAEAESDPARQRRFLARGLRPYNVLSVGALGVLVISGASALTDLKARYGAEYARLIWPLAGKLGLTFLLINVATYLSFGLAHRLVRAELGQLPVDGAQQAGMIRRMRSAGWLALALAAWTTWVGLRLTS